MHLWLWDIGDELFTNVLTHLLARYVQAQTIHYEADIPADLGVVFGVPSLRADLGVAAARLGVCRPAVNHPQQTHQDETTTWLLHTNTLSSSTTKTLILNNASTISSFWTDCVSIRFVQQCCLYVDSKVKNYVQLSPTLHRINIFYIPQAWSSVCLVTFAQTNN